jgi:prepilin-type N-terminal cleavage/methylation domain-containing protein
MSTSPRRPPPFRARRGRGFTLVEIMMAVIIFSLLVASLFTILDGSFTATGALDQTQRGEQSLEALNAWLDRGFRTMPPQATVTAAAKGSDKNTLEVVIRDHPGFTGWLGESVGALTTGLALRPQQNGLYALSMCEVKQNKWEWQSSMLPTDAASWTLLLHDVKSAQWRFYDGRTRNWLDTWSDAAYRPSNIELSLQIADDPEPVVLTFWCPAAPDAGAVAGGDTAQQEKPQ